MREPSCYLLYAISVLMTQVKSAHLLKSKQAVAHLLKSKQAVKFTQDPYRVHITGLPAQAPDSPITTIVLECESEPKQDTIFVRNNKPRAGV